VFGSGYVRIGLTFAQLFAIITLSHKMYFHLYVDAKLQMNKHGMLITSKAVTSIANKTKQAYTVQKDNANFTAVNIGIGIGHKNFFT